MFDVKLWTPPDNHGRQRCLWVGTVKGFDELGELVESSGCVGGVLDYMPELTETEAFCRRQAKRGRQFFRAGYTLEGKKTIKWHLSTHEPFMVDVHRTKWLDDMVYAVRKRDLTFPAKYVDDEQGRLFTHLRSPKKVTEEGRDGLPETRWRHEPTNPDHQFHRTALGFLAGFLVTRGAGGGRSSYQE